MPSNTPHRPSAKQRRQIIVDTVERTGVADVNAIADALQVSAMTIRRDMSHLDEIGTIRRIHGGATTRPAPSTRSAAFKSEKNSIAKAVSALIDGPSTVGLDVGTTCTAVAAQLSSRDDVTIISNSLHAAFECQRGSAEFLVLGGKLTPEGATVHGNVQNELNVNLDVLVLGCGGISPAEGVTYHDWDENVLRRNMRSRAKRVVLATDHTKFNRLCPHILCGLNEIDTLVTDEAPDTELLLALRTADVEMIVAG